MDMDLVKEEIISTREIVHAKIPARSAKEKKNKVISGKLDIARTLKKASQTNLDALHYKAIKSDSSLKLVYPEPQKNNKIALLSWNSSYGKSDGHDGVYVSNLASALAKEGQEIHVFTRKKGKQSDNEKIDGAYYHRIHIDTNIPFLDRIKKFGNRIYDRIKRIESREQPFNVIHCSNWHPVKAVKSLQNGKTRQVVLTMHSNINLERYEYKGMMNAKFDLILKELIKTSNKVICLDKKIKSEMQDILPSPEEKLIIIPEAFNWEDFQGISDQGEFKRRYNIGPIDPTILFVGEFNDAYAPDILADAIPALLKNNPQLRFLFVGDGDLMWPIKVKAHYLYFEHAIRLVGHKEGRELHELFQTSDIVVIPNRKEIGQYQVLAAWSAKKPVVATKAGSCGLINHEENGICIYDNPGSVVWGIEKIIYDWNKAYKMANKGWERIINNYTWDAIAKKLKTIYQCNNSILKNSFSKK